MPRTARAARGGYCYHVINRGNERAEVFHCEDDYHAFASLLRQACARVEMRVIGYCLMPNHFHCLLWPPGDKDMAQWMDWLLTTHAARYRKRYGGSGHVWQGRYKAFPIEQDDHLLTVLRYVERNALRANLVERAGDWPWSSLPEWVAQPALPWLDPGPVARGPDWLQHVNEARTEAELARVRRSVRRGAPYGSEPWVKQTAAALGLEFTMRSRGRPRGRARPKVAEQSDLFDQNE
jgi:putative transposase